MTQELLGEGYYLSVFDNYRQSSYPLLKINQPSCVSKNIEVIEFFLPINFQVVTSIGRIVLDNLRYVCIMVLKCLVIQTFTTQTASLYILLNGCDHDFLHHK